VTIQQYLGWYDDVLAPTERMLRLVPSDKLGWKLTETSFTLGQLIDHLGKALLFNSKVMGGEEWPLKSIREILVTNRRHPEATVDGAVETFEHSRRRFREVVERLDEEHFQHGEIDTPQLGRLPVWRFAAFVVEHHIHHVMELHISLKVLGVKVHTGTLYSAG
jgi:hypothetical protein